ncbi:hypothetical protein Tsubulata_038517, partial [Turnera subulata]
TAVICLLLLHRSLRPCRISPKRFVPAHIELPDWAVDGIPKIEPNSDLQHVVEFLRWPIMTSPMINPLFHSKIDANLATTPTISRAMATLPIHFHLSPTTALITPSTQSSLLSPLAAAAALQGKM